MLENSEVKQALRRGAFWANYTGAYWLAEHLMGVIKEIDTPQVTTVASQEQEEGRDGKVTVVLQGEPLAQPSCTV